MIDDTTTVETPLVEENVVEEVQDELSLDDLMNADFGDDAVMQGSHKGLPDYKKILEHIPENGRKLVQNLRSSYTQKTSEIAELKKQIVAEREELRTQRELLSNSDFANKVRETASKEPEHDAWSDEGLEERINIKAHKLMQDMLTPLQQDLAAQSRSASLNSFKSEHPDLVSDALRIPIAKMLMDRPDLKLEDAYYIVKGQVVKNADVAAKTAARETLRKTSTGTAVRNGEAPKFRDAFEAYTWHKNNGVK